MTSWAPVHSDALNKRENHPCNSSSFHSTERETALRCRPQHARKLGEFDSGMRDTKHFVDHRRDTFEPVLAGANTGNLEQPELVANFWRRVPEFAFATHRLVSQNRVSCNLRDVVIRGQWPSNPEDLVSKRLAASPGNQ